jgi:hypothetical protein
MTIGRNQHVVSRNGEGHETPGRTASLRSRNPVIDRGREVSCNQHSKLFVHGRDACTREQDSDSHNPMAQFI